LRDFVDFVDSVASGENISHTPLLFWWNEFVDGAEKAELQIGRTHQTITAMRVEHHLHRLLSSAIFLVTALKYLPKSRSSGSPSSGKLMLNTTLSFSMSDKLSPISSPVYPTIMVCVHTAQGRLCLVCDKLRYPHLSMPQIGSKRAPAHMKLTGTSALLRVTAHTQTKIRVKTGLVRNAG
jgi:hypothetical protein